MKEPKNINNIFENIAFRDKIITIPSWRFKIRISKRKEKFFDNIDDAIKFAIDVFYNSKKCKYIQIFVSSNIDMEMTHDEYKSLEGLDYSKYRSKIIKYVNDGFYCFPNNFSEVYFEYFNFNDGSEFALDYRLAFSNNKIILDENKVYISDFTKNFLSYSNTLHYGRKNMKVENPIKINHYNLENIKNDGKFAHSMIYGYGFGNVSNHKSGIMSDWNDTYPFIIPVTTIKEYGEKRPIYKDYKRYKIYLKVISNCEYKDHIWSLYIDIRKSEKDLIKKLVKLSISDETHWSCRVKPIRIEQIPDGEWI